MAESVSGDRQAEHGLRDLLSLRGYPRLATAYALNELGWFVSTLALSVLVYRRTDSALAATAFFLCSQAAPALVGPPFVARVDRTSPRRLLPTLYGVEALLFALLALTAHHLPLAPLLALVLVDGVIALAARSLAAAARTELLKPAGMLREGSAVASIGFSTAYLAGPLIGGVITAVGGSEAALFVASGVFALMALTLLSPSIPESTVHEGPDQGRLRAALAHIRHNRPVSTILALQSVLAVCVSIPTPIEVVYTVHTLHAGSVGYGVLLSVWGGSALVGSLAYARWRRGETRVLLGISILLGGVGFGVLAIAPDLGVALVGAVIAGVSNGLGTVAFGVQFQESVPQSWMALAASVNQALLQLAPGIGIAIGGVLAATISVRFAFGVAAVVSLTFAGVTVLGLTPTRLGSGPPPMPPDAPDRDRSRDRTPQVSAGTGADADVRPPSLA